MKVEGYTTVWDNVSVAEVRSWFDDMVARHARRLNRGRKRKMFCYKNLRKSYPKDEV